MNNREAHFYLEELQRMMTQHRGIFSEEFVCANGMAILALEQERKKGKWIVNILDYESKCSICGADETAFIHGTEMWYGIGKSKFCSNCGAEMKGEGDG